VASQYNEVGSREKEVIGDAIRNAAMRFGAALEFWHKGELHVPAQDEPPDPENTEPLTKGEALQNTVEIWKTNITEFAKTATVEEMKAYWPDKKAEIIHDCGMEMASTVYQFLLAETNKKATAP